MDIRKEVNEHFLDFMSDWEHRFYMLVGGYGSSKSYHIALKIILKCIKEKRKVLVIREVYETIRESCFSLFEELAEDLHLTDENHGQPVMRFIQLWRIACRAEDVTAKAEIVPKTVQEVPFAPAVPDGTGLDESHILGERG